MLSCPRCGVGYDPGVRFCTGCGMNLADAPSVSASVCAKCGAALAPEVKFCTGCGAPTQAAPPPAAAPPPPPAIPPEPEPAPVPVRSGSGTCTTCGALLWPGEPGCTRCGAVLEPARPAASAVPPPPPPVVPPEPAPAPAASGLGTCVKCGAMLWPGEKFCTGCGTVVAQAPAGSAPALPTLVDAPAAPLAAPPPAAQAGGMTTCPKCGGIIWPGEQSCSVCRTQTPAPFPAPAPTPSPYAAPLATPESYAAAAPETKRGPAILVTAIVILALAAAGVGGWLLYRRYNASKTASAPAASAQAALPGQQDAGATPSQEILPVPAPAPPDQPGTNAEPAPVPPPQPPSMTSSSSATATTPRTVQPPRNRVSPTVPSSSSYVAPEVAAPPSRQQGERLPEPIPSPPPPSRTEIPRPEPAAPPPPAAPSREVYSGPPSGTMLWSGQLQKNGVITIDGASASAGSLTGELPGVPVMVEVKPSDVGLAEAPSSSNGWRRLVLRSRVNRQMVVTIRWMVLR